MQVRLRELRKRLGLTLLDVANRCDPPTTAQTIGRLETGMRTMSVDWLNRIAGALGVEASELVSLPDRDELPLAAVLRGGRPETPAIPGFVRAPSPLPGDLALRVETAIGDYRAGDELVLERLEGPAIAKAVNADVLTETAGGRMVFARLLPGSKPDRVSLAPLESGSAVIADVRLAWAARVSLLIRRL
jgi:transcriptional regulator with XRE-family HTH domain